MVEALKERKGALHRACCSILLNVPYCRYGRNPKGANAYYWVVPFRSDCAWLLTDAHDPQLQSSNRCLTSIQLLVKGQCGGKKNV